jgi:aminoglycoside phosphotransferase (APT) family kinase protein
VRHPGAVIGSGGSRVRWAELPRPVRVWVEELLGEQVVEAVSQSGGFSPGSADRVRTAAGTRAFVKAVSADLNPDSPGMHRREARVAAALPPELPAPALLGSYDQDGWVALAFADVDGRTPQLPWQAAELDPVLDALAVLAGVPCPVPDLPQAPDRVAEMFTGAHRLAADGVAVDGLDLPALVEPALAALGGDTLVHFDLRADNVLLTAGRAVLVDWPHACRGPRWLDALVLLMEVERFGGHDVDALLAAHPATREVEPAILDGALAGCLGYFFDQARRPAPAGLPRVRAFQRVQGEAVLAWLHRRRSAR